MPASSDDGDTAPISSLVEAELWRDDGKLLGIVDELLIDLRSGRIEYLLATGVRGQRLRFPWSAIRVAGGGFVVRRSSPHLVVDSRRPNR